MCGCLKTLAASAWGPEGGGFGLPAPPSQVLIAPDRTTHGRAFWACQSPCLHKGPFLGCDCAGSSAQWSRVVPPGCSATHPPWAQAPTLPCPSPTFCATCSSNLPTWWWACAGAVTAAAFPICLVTGGVESLFTRRWGVRVPAFTQRVLTSLPCSRQVVCPILSGFYFFTYSVYQSYECVSQIPFSTLRSTGIFEVFFICFQIVASAN